MSKYGPEITAEIAGYLENGSNRTDANILAGISYETFSKWMKEHVEFNEAIKKAEVHFKNANINIIRKAAITTWQAAAWLLERKYRDEFALKLYEKDPADKEIPQRMADRAAEILEKVQRRIPVVTSTNGNGNGVHP